MSATNINIRTDSDIKENAERIFEQLGMSMSTAVNVFLRQTIRENGIPFELKLGVPSEALSESIREGRKIAKDKSIKEYSTVAELKKSLEI